jgi:hypothetical protein
VSDPPLSHVVTLAGAFGVEPSYLVDGTGEALTGGEIARAPSDNKVREIALGCARLPAGGKRDRPGHSAAVRGHGRERPRRIGSALGRPAGRPTLGHATLA